MRKLTIASKGVLVTALVWAGMYAVVVMGNQHVIKNNFHPITLGWVAYVTATAVAIIFYFVGKNESLKKMPKKGVSWAVWAGILGAGVADLVLFYGYKYSNPINWSVLVSTIPIPTYFLTVLFLGEKWVRDKQASILLVVFGAVLVVVNFSSGVSVSKGDWLFIGSVLAYAFVNILAQKGLQILDVKRFTLVRLASAAVTMSMIMVLMRPVLNRDYLWYAVLYGLSVFVFITLANKIIKKAGATFFTMSVNMVPVLVLILSGLFLGEWATVTQMLGGVLVVGGVLWFLKIGDSKGS